MSGQNPDFISTGEIADAIAYTHNCCCRFQLICARKVWDVIAPQYTPRAGTGASTCLTNNTNNTMPTAITHLKTDCQQQVFVVLVLS